MKLADFDFDLPEDRIATRPASPRPSARLLLAEGDSLGDLHVRDLVAVLRPGDRLVLNNTRVIPARLFGTRRRGEAVAKVEITLLEPAADGWRALAKPLRKLAPGEVIRFSDQLSAEVAEKSETDLHLRFNLTGADFDAALEAAGAMPLPPYIAAKRPADDRDKSDYQTVFARHAGAVAAPTASLHFDAALLAALAQKGVTFSEVTLHVGAGTFLPVKVEDVTSHRMHAEWGEVTPEAAAAINATRAAGGRIIPVGTTALRLIETAAASGRVEPWRGPTDIFIYPGYRFRVTDALMTNFHLPKSTLLMLVSALMGKDRIDRIYGHALTAGYRFFSYGDASLLIPPPRGLTPLHRGLSETAGARPGALLGCGEITRSTMLKVLAQSWPLLLGIMLLMVGNGVQGSLLGIRGALEGFSTFQLSVVMSAYFLGFLSGSRLAPGMIRRVGHVRVFSALGSLISAVLVLYPMALDWTVPRWLAAEESWLTLALQPWVLWSLMRVLIGFCFSGIYVTAESWLNNTATNETRGQALSAYMIVQMLGIIASQGLLALGDPTGYGLFIIPSVLVSLAFMPLLLADVPAPTFASIKPMKFRTLFRISPLGCAGMLLTGGVFSAMFGMASVYGAKSAMTISQIAAFVAAMYVGGLLLQYPVGWLSDRFDRRLLILWMSAIGAVVMAVATMIALPFQFELIVALLLGGVINPLYSLLIAHTNDFLGKEEMPAASAGLIFLNGFGAIFGPLIAGWVMGPVGAKGYFLVIGAFFAALAGYAAWRMTRRAAPAAHSGYAGLTPTASSLAVEAVRGEDQPR